MQIKNLKLHALKNRTKAWLNNPMPLSKCKDSLPTSLAHLGFLNVPMMSWVVLHHCHWDSKLPHWALTYLSHTHVISTPLSLAVVYQTAQKSEWGEHGEGEGSCELPVRCEPVPMGDHQKTGDFWHWDMWLSKALPGDGGDRSQHICWRGEWEGIRWHMKAHTVLVLLPRSPHGSLWGVTHMGT